MKNKLFSLMAAGLIAIGVSGPAMAGDGPLGSVSSWLGSVTAFIVDVPEGILYHSLYNCPLKTSQYLAESFGDENGAGQKRGWCSFRRTYWNSLGHSLWCHRWCQTWYRYWMGKTIQHRVLYCC